MNRGSKVGIVAELEEWATAEDEDEDEEYVEAD